MRGALKHSQSSWNRSPSAREKMNSNRQAKKIPGSQIFAWNTTRFQERCTVRLAGSSLEQRPFPRCCKVTLVLSSWIQQSSLHTHTHPQTWDRPRWEVARGGFCAAESALIKGKRNCTRHRLQLSSTRCRSRLPTTWASAMSAVSQESLNTLVVISIKSPSLSLPHLTYAELQPTCSGAKGGDRAQGAHVPS